jgi:predicted CoA-binding protein
MSHGISYSDDFVRSVLSGAKTIAVVGASPNPLRASHYVMAYLQSRGYRTIPVNPHVAGREINGEKVYARLADVPAPVDLVDVFRNSSAAADAVDQAVAEKNRLGIKFIWMQLGVRNDEAAHRAKAAGIARWSWTAVRKSSTHACSAQPSSPLNRRPPVQSDCHPGHEGKPT